MGYAAVKGLQPVDPGHYMRRAIIILDIIQAYGLTKNSLKKLWCGCGIRRDKIMKILKFIEERY